MATWRRYREGWTRATLVWSLSITAFCAITGVIVGLIWGGHAGSSVGSFWIGGMALVLTNDLRPHVNTPRSVLRKVRP